MWSKLLSYGLFGSMLCKHVLLRLRLHDLTSVRFPGLS